MGISPAFLNFGRKPVQSLSCCNQEVTEVEAGNIATGWNKWRNCNFWISELPKSGSGVSETVISL